MKKVSMTIEKSSYGVREAIKTLRTNIQFCGDDKQVLLVTSCIPGEGKSEVSIRLAQSIAEIGKSVILVDADMRNSKVASRLQIVSQDKGLTHFLSGQCTLAEVIVATNIPKMHLLLSGPAAPNPTELLETKRFQGLIESMREVYDYIIIDCPPFGLVVDAAIVSRVSDGAIMVVEAGRTKYRMTQTVKEKLENAGVPILGVVLNKVDQKRQVGYYGSEYKKGGYGAYFEQHDDSTEK